MQALQLRFGTAGIPLSVEAKKRSTETGLIRLDELGLRALEIEFVRGVYLNDEKAVLVRDVAESYNITLSCHAPYYINLNSSDPEKTASSRARILASARAAHFAGATSVVFHPAFYHGMTREQVYLKVRDEVAALRQEMDEAGYDKVILRPETMGKISQFGDLEETARLSADIPGVLPCVDFGHLHARSAGLNNTYDEFCVILDFLAETLGDRWNSSVHFHVSGMDYGASGEKKHLVFAEADFNYKDLVRAWHSFGVRGTAICESPNLEEDAMILQKAYESAAG
jgi:deoxyribonuclease-4